MRNIYNDFKTKIENLTQCGFLIYMSLVIGFVVYLNYCFPFTGDDLCFAAMKIDKWNELLSYALNFGNGRILGNMGILYLTDSVVIRVIWKTICMLGICFFIYDIWGEKDRKIFLLIILLVLFPSQPIFVQCYQWTAGFQNFVPPVFWELFCLWIVMKSENSTGIRRLFLNLFIFIVAIIANLYAENSTVIHMILAVGVLLYGIFKRKLSIEKVLYFIATLIGTVMMFAIPHIYHVSANMDGYRSVASGKYILINGIYNLNTICDGMIGNYLLWALISISCIWIIKGIENYNIRVLKSYLIAFPVFSFLWTNMLQDYVIMNDIWKYLLKFISLFLYVGIVIFILLKKWDKDWKIKSKVILPIIIGILALGELLVVSPIGGRTFYLPYICFIIGTVKLYVCQMDGGNENIKESVAFVGKIILFSLCIVFSLMFRENHYVDRIRTQYVEKMISQGADVIEYPLLPHQVYVYDDGRVSDALDLLYCREKKGDIRFEIREWENWTVEHAGEY